MHEDEAYNADPYGSAMKDIQTALQMALSNSGSMSEWEANNLNALLQTQMSLDPSLFVA